MKKVLPLFLGAVTVSSILITPVSASTNLAGRWYSGYQSPDAGPGVTTRYSTWNYYGAHTTLKSPSTSLSLNTSTLYSMSTNFLNVDLYDTPTDYYTTWWMQVGYTHGYDAAATYHGGYTSYEEYGISRKDGTQTAHETIETDQPLNTAWDYYVRWDSASSSWKTNINGNVKYFLSGFPSTGHISAEGEVNFSDNKNWGNYSNNTYFDGISTWYPFDSSFTPYTDTGSYVSGTPTNYTVSR